MVCCQLSAAPQLFYTHPHPIEAHLEYIVEFGMTSSKHLVRLLIKGFLSIAFRVYYRSIQVQGAEAVPEEGAVLLVGSGADSQGNWR